MFVEKYPVVKPPSPKTGCFPLINTQFVCILDDQHQLDCGIERVVGTASRSSVLPVQRGFNTEIMPCFTKRKFTSKISGELLRAFLHKIVVTSVVWNKRARASLRFVPTRCVLKPQAQADPHMCGVGWLLILMHCLNPHLLTDKWGRPGRSRPIYSEFKLPCMWDLTVRHLCSNDPL